MSSDRPETTLSPVEAYRLGQGDMLARAVRCVQARSWHLQPGSDMPRALSVLRVMDLGERPGGGK